MTEKNVEESNISMAAAELRDLIHYWDNLSFWEREQSLVTVNDYLDEASSCSSDAEAKQIEKMHAQVDALTSSNQIEKKSRVKSLLSEPSSELTVNERKKPNYNQSMDVIKSLSKSELIQLGEYLNMNRARLSFMRPTELHLMFEEVLTTKSIAVFFALRNYLGRTHM